MGATCAWCGREFTPDRRARKFCRQPCYFEYQRSERSRRHHAVCERCGAAFSSPASQPQRFCSRSCYMSTIKDARTIKTCRVCGRTFDVAPGQANRFTACSIECRWRETEHAACVTCGKSFRTQRGRLSHCSEACRRPPVMVECLNCSKSFRVVPSNAKSRRHCSMRRYRAFTGETEPESNVRRILGSLGVDFEQEFAIPGVRGPVDFMVAGRLALEVDGAYWHAKRPEVDQRKNAAIRAAGFDVVRITDDGLYGKVTTEMVAIVERALARAMVDA